jgi:AraC family transcriptional activator of pyochelin receptor
VRISASFAELNAELRAYRERVVGPRPFSGADEVFPWPARFGRGLVRRAELRPDLDLHLFDVVLPRGFRLAFGAQDVPLQLAFCLSGLARVTIPGSHSTCTFDAGSGGFFFGHDVDTVSHYPTGGRLYAISLIVHQEALGSLLGDPTAALPAALADALLGHSAAPYFHLTPTPPELRPALAGIAGCPYTGQLRRIYLEGKALELLSLYLAASGQAATPGSLAMRPDDVARLTRARDVLAARMEDPPSLVGLARQVGLNDFKLKQGFKQLFGTTAFGYLHRLRMERARALLEQREMSVTQVATSVGYANVSHFAAAFRRRFGMPPRSFLARQRATP